MDDNAELDFTPDSELEQLLERLNDRSAALDAVTTKGLVCSGEWAARLIQATQHVRVGWAGHVVGDVRLPGTVEGGIWITGGGTVEGDIRVDVGGTVTGDIWITGGGTVEGGIRVADGGTVTGDIKVADAGTVEGGIWVADDGTVEGGIWVVDGGIVKGRIWITGGGTVKGGIWITGGGIVKGDIRVDVCGTVEGGIWVVDDGTMTGGILAYGSVTHVEVLAANVQGECILAPSSLLRVASLNQAKLGSSMILGENVTLIDCDLRNFDYVDKLRIVGPEVFSCRLKDCDGLHLDRHLSDDNEQITDGPESESVGTNRQHVRHHGIRPAELTGIYRRLRVSREKAGDRPGASDFYFREMEARREAAKPKSLERAVLAGYKVMSEFGTSPKRPALWFAVVWVLGSVLFVVAGMDLGPDATGQLVHAELTGSGEFLGDEVAIYSFLSMVSFLKPPSTEYLTTFEQTLQIGLRIVGPLLLAQILLAIRERVAR